MIGNLIGNRYTLQTIIGMGGMGTVYGGIDSQTNQQVAIKQLNSDMTSSEMIERFKREGEALRDLNHPNIVKMLEMLEEDGQYFLVMEYVSGGSLRDLLDQEADLDYKRCVDIAIDLADALTRTHRLGIIHRDLKPANILIDEDNQIKLTDFGVAHINEKDRVTGTDVIVGTIHYLAPEALDSGKVNELTDIWAFGVILFEMLTGQHPFQRESLSSILTAILTDKLPDIDEISSDIPDALIDLVYRMLDRDIESRISSVRYVGAELSDILQGRVRQIPRFATPPSNRFYRPKHNIPAQTTTFVGREPDIEELNELLHTPSTRLISLIAPGGMGKTSLSLEIARRAIEQFPDGVYFVELAPVSDANGIPSAIAAASGYEFQADTRETGQQIIDFLSNKTILLVMDNYEHLPEGFEFVGDILAGAPKVKILVTSRRALNQPGETLYNLSSMDYSSLESDSLEHKLAHPVIKLFLNSAKRVKPDFYLSEHNIEAVIHICRLVHGVPLGILLSAGWLTVLPANEIAEELQISFELLETNKQELPERQRSMSAVMNYSWTQMTSAEQAVFTKLSVFRGGFSREAAKIVAGASLRELLSLVNKSFLKRETNSGYFEIHGLLRQYAEEKLTATELEHLKEVHAQYYVELTERAKHEFYSEKQSDWYKILDREQDNIRSVLNWSMTVRNAELGMKIIAYLCDFWRYNNQHREGIHWCNLALTHRHHVNQTDLARVLLTLGYLNDGNTLVARENLEKWLIEALDILRQSGNESDVSWALACLATIYLANFPDRFMTALDYAQQAIEQARRHNHFPQLAYSLNILGVIYWMRLDDFASAKTTIEQGLVIARQHNNALREFHLLINLVLLVSKTEPQNTEAIKIAVQNVNIAMKSDFKTLIYYAMVNLSYILVMMKNYELGIKILASTLSHMEANDIYLNPVAAGLVNEITEIATQIFELGEYNRLQFEGAQLDFYEAIQITLRL